MIVEIYGRTKGKPSILVRGNLRDSPEKVTKVFRLIKIILSKKEGGK